MVRFLLKTNAISLLTRIERITMRKPIFMSSRKQSAWPGTIRTFAQYTHLGWTLVAAVVLGLLAGRWADAQFGTAPWMLIIGSLLGIGSGLYHFLKTTLR